MLLLRLLQCPESDHCAKFGIFQRYLGIYDGGNGCHELFLLFRLHIDALHPADELNGVLHSHALHHRRDDHTRAAVPTGTVNQDILSVGQLPSYVLEKIESNQIMVINRV